MQPPDPTLTENTARATIYEYDLLGRRTHRFLPGAASLDDVTSNSSMEKVGYEKIGPFNGPWTAKKSVWDFRNKLITYFYDPMGRLTTKSLPQVTAGADVGRTVTYTYTGALLTQVSEVGTGVNRTEYSAYDNSRRLRKKDSPEGVLTYTYNARGQLATLKGFARPAVTANAEVGAAVPDADLEYGYDPLGRLQTVKNYKKGATQNVSTNWYDLAGNLVETSYPNNTRHHWDYTEQNRMKSTVVEKVAGSAATLLRRYDYTLNAAGLRTAVSEKETPTTYYRNMQYKYDYADPLPVVGTTTAGGATTEYRAELPKLNRLTRESIQTPATGVYNSADYTYDLVGNRLKRVDGGLGSGNQTLEYDVKDRVAGTSSPLGFDANGNTTTSANGTVLDYYDAENRLLKRVSGTTTITMGYDPSGNRAWKHVQTGSTHKNIYYLVDDLNPTGYPQVIAEYSDTSATVNQNSGTFYAGYEYGLDLISQRHPTSGVLYFSYDGQGSVRSLFNTLGDLSTSYRWDYDAWGKHTLNLAGTIDTRYRYNGEQWDPELGLYYLRSRYYSPEYGRFWSMDTIEGANAEPSSLHKYMYCINDPVNRIDPLGTESRISATTGYQAVGDGQHIIPFSTWDEIGFDEEAMRFLDSDSARIPTPGGHNFTAHARYNHEIRAEWEKFLETAEGSRFKRARVYGKDAAEEFLKHVKGGGNKFIAGFNAVVGNGPKAVDQFMRVKGVKMAISPLRTSFFKNAFARLGKRLPYLKYLAAGATYATALEEARAANDSQAVAQLKALLEAANPLPFSDQDIQDAGKAARLELDRRQKRYDLNRFGNLLSW